MDFICNKRHSHNPHVFDGLPLLRYYMYSEMQKWELDSS